MQGETVLIRQRATDHLWRTILLGWADIVFYAPALIIIGVYDVQPDWLWLWLLFPFALTAAGSLLAFASSGRIGSLWSVILPLFLVSIACAELVAKHDTVWPVALCSAAGLVVAIRSASHWRTISGISQILTFLLGIVLHIVAFYVFSILAPLSGWLVAITITAMISLGITLYSFNQFHLDSLLLERDRIRGLPARTMLYNRLSIALVICGIWLVFGIGILIFGFSRFHPGTPENIAPNLPTQPSQKHQILPPLKGKKPTHVQAPSHPSLWMTIIRDVVLVAFLAAIAIGLIWLIWKKIIPYMTALYRQLNRKTAVLQAGYIDEEETLSRNTRSMRKNRRHRKQREATWAELGTTAEQIRYLYRALIHQAHQQGFTWKPTSTAAETIQDIETWQASSSGTQQVLDDTLSEHIGPLYDQARYSDRMEIDQAEVEALKKALDEHT
ncbi:DUF4129 domain-containing protein [Alicyclobacillus fodiniaquatilis]|jgi:hypothetical protein|uniref:DUF4129 domain-containing protein n=1 Tax=Alicyclobacillus fodiniaquatilis TaxID=1661150 RepID=A0ABW4JI37_9BACL